ncbi:addiction module protein [Luteolibacter yonseiensis]
MDLPPRQKIALAGFLLETTSIENDPDAEAAWDHEIGERIHAIDQGWVTGVPYSEVMTAAKRLLAQ